MRRAPLSGLAFVACFGLAAGLYGSGAGRDPAAIAAYYAGSGDRLRQIGGFAALVLGCLFLLAYVAVLVREVVPEEPAATLALLSGGGSALVLAAAGALWSATAFTVELEPGYRPEAASHLLVEDAAFALVVAAAALAIPFVLAVSLAARGSLPRWFAALGVAAAACLAAAYWYVPLAGFLLWIACGSLLLARPRVP